MTVIARPRNNYGFLFGSGADGDVTIAANTNLPSTLNGGIIYRNYRNLTINSGCTLSVSNKCKGLWIRVRGTLTLNGIIDMTGKGCYNPSPADLFLGYSDIKIPAIGAAAGQPVLDTNANGNPGANGVNGQCGGAGAGASAFYDASKKSNGGAGSAGHCSGGGQGGGGGAADYLDNWHYVAGTLYNQATAAQPYGAGAGVQGSWRQVGQQYPESPDDSYVIVGTGGAGASPSGGILIVMAREIIGNGLYRSNGSKGGDGNNTWEKDDLRNPGGGGSGAGSIVVYYQQTQSLNSQVLGGDGGQNIYGTGHKGGKGGDGSVRDWSLMQLASHTRI